MELTTKVTLDVFTCLRSGTHVAKMPSKNLRSFNPRVNSFDYLEILANIIPHMCFTAPLQRQWLYLIADQRLTM